MPKVITLQTSFNSGVFMTDLMVDQLAFLTFDKWIDASLSTIEP